MDTKILVERQHVYPKQCIPDNYNAGEKKLIYTREATTHNCLILYISKHLAKM
jgi:hypothetical protein